MTYSHHQVTNLCVCVYVFRYIFLFDKVVIVCKRKGYSYELKEIIELQSYKMSDDPMNNRDMKKVRNDKKDAEQNNLLRSAIFARQPRLIQVIKRKENPV